MLLKCTHADCAARPVVVASDISISHYTDLKKSSFDFHIGFAQRQLENRFFAIRIYGEEAALFSFRFLS